MEQDVKTYIDQEIKKAMAFATKKYGDTPTDALQLVPKKYVSSVVAGLTNTAGGSNTQVQFNDGGTLGGATNFTWNKTFNSNAGALSLLNSASFSQGDANVSSWGMVEGFLLTTNATPTNLHVTTLGANEFGMLFEAYVSAKRTGGIAGATGDSAGYVRRAEVKSIASTPTVVGSVQDDFTAEDQAGWDVTIAFSGQDVCVQVTGAADNNITWGISARFLRLV